MVGVDITLEDIDRFLNSEPQAQNGVLAILGDDGKLIARSSLDDPGSKIAKEAVLKALQSQVLDPDPDQTTAIDVDGETWITHISNIGLGAGEQENLAIALPLSDVVGAITQASRRTILVSVLLALASIPLIWLISRTMSRPLQHLSDGIGRIRNFELDKPFPKTSRVDEIYRLQSAMEQMRTALQTFGRYIPKALVRQMIERQLSAEPGGDRRDVTVLFMDLENFTAMSSQLEPEEVMRRMSRYFEIVTQTLQAHDATIDKYIGDAVMAFWNAPNAVEDHPKKACEAALAVIAACKAETDSWRGDGILPVRTRIGLHAGPAIIGNVGSSDRLNYTALGDTVNLASRLEGLNRELGTSILISGSLAERLNGAIELKPAGDFPIKGYETPVAVFEVLAANPPPNP